MDHPLDTPQATTTDDPVTLTQRELECLLWVSRGKTAWEIAHILDITERTVVFHIENAKAKFGVRSRTQAVAKAVIEGHIPADWI